MIISWIAGLLAVLGGLVLLRAEVHRRRVAGTQFWKNPSLSSLDLPCPAAAFSLASIALAHISPTVISFAHPSLNLAWLAEATAGFAISYHLWREGTRTLQLQRPDGVVFAQFLILAGATYFAVHAVLDLEDDRPGRFSRGQTAAVFLMLAGGTILLWIIPRFLRGREQHRIVRHTDRWGESVQPEYYRPTRECPNPERWRMFDPMTAEVEVLEFLECLITTVKPELVVETGTFTGLSTLYMAMGMQKNGFGKIISCDYDPLVFAKAKQRIEASGLSEWIELRNESSLEMKVAGRIDLLFSDTQSPIREQEVRRFLPQLNPSGLIVMHDANSRSKIVREAALRLEREGVVSVVFLPTPRGLALLRRNMDKVGTGNGL